jgi:hypothetical protein
MVSRFQTLLAQPVWTGRSPIAGTKAIRAMIGLEYAQQLITIAAIGSIASLAFGVSIETDPASSNFLKIKIGNTRIDPFWGLIQPTVLLARVISGKTKTSGGKVKSILRDAPFGQQKLPEYIFNFFRQKLNPSLEAAVTLRTGENIVGDIVNPEDFITSWKYNIFIPLAWKEIFDIMEEHSVPTALSLQLLNLLGAGIHTYDPVQQKIERKIKKLED